MKKRNILISMMLVATAAITGCATTGDLEKMQAQQSVINAKADQAIQDAQAAKSAADSAKSAADTAKGAAEAAKAKAEEAEKKAAEREMVANQKAARADAAFQKSMKK